MTHPLQTESHTAERTDAPVALTERDGRAPAPAARPLGTIASPTAPPMNELPVSLSIKNLSGWYGDFKAVRDVSLNIPARRITALIGPSGCGKSTFLRWINRMNDMIAGARAEGVIDLHGENLLDRKIDAVRLRRRIGMVFQRPNPFPKSIYDNVAFGPRLHYRLTRRDTDALVQGCLQRAALWDEVKDRLRSSALGISGGQQQRLCIARAIATGPELLLMDEPCSALDPKSTAAIERLMQELCEEYTIVIVTHNMQQAARISDYTAFMYAGDLVEYGPTQKIFSNPENKQTEEYISGRFG